ncbi:hypothetical protein RND81_01G094200 [Saponaria officinalis]|uniref:ARM repeat N-terminal plant domain-containing protein n=1 Tax=Saponaria officinalis TaxID=3572 RepID=A0AAW1NDY3_SAPOF
MDHQRNTQNVIPTNSTCNQSCTSSVCLFCITREFNVHLRRNRISDLFKTLPELNEDENILVLSWLWNIAQARPDDPYEFTSLGVFECMGRMIQTGVHDKEWLSRGQNIYIPYYAAHVIGSYTMSKSEFAEKAVQAGVVPPLMELFRGKMSWVEQRVGVRVLGHLASYETTFSAIVAYEEEIVYLAMGIASNCLEEVYEMNVVIKERDKRVKYHTDLLTRGIGGTEIENRKAEEWASQLQCWSLHLLSCFVYKSRCLDLICKSTEFLDSLCDMWGGLVNDSCSAGYGLIRHLCYSKYGRKRIVERMKIVECLGNLARSSDDWQYVGIESLLMLVKDPDTRFKVIDVAISFLVDLVELRTVNCKSNVGKKIISVLFLHSREVRQMIERRESEQVMGELKMDERKVLVDLTKQQGNMRFRSGDIEEALSKYSEGLELCPLKLRKERVVLYSNRAQCHLLLRNPDAAISDTTKALCLVSPHTSHSKSLWRRSQAYDMKGLARESLMDCLMFVNCCTDGNSANNVNVPYYATHMISKHMSDVWLFKDAQLKFSMKQSRHGHRLGVGNTRNTEPHIHHCRNEMKRT